MGKGKDGNMIMDGYIIETFIPDVEQDKLYTQFLTGTCEFSLNGNVQRVPMSINVTIIDADSYGCVKYTSSIRSRAFKVEYLDGSFDWAEYITDHLGENGRFCTKWNNSHPRQKKIKRIFFGPSRCGTNPSVH